MVHFEHVKVNCGTRFMYFNAHTAFYTLLLFFTKFFHAHLASNQTETWAYVVKDTQFLALICHHQTWVTTLDTAYSLVAPPGLLYRLIGLNGICDINKFEKFGISCCCCCCCCSCRRFFATAGSVLVKQDTKFQRKQYIVKKSCKNARINCSQYVNTCTYEIVEERVKLISVLWFFLYRTGKGQVKI